MKEVKALPQSARIAYQEITTRQQKELRALVEAVSGDLSLNPNDPWHLDFQTGIASRDVPDAPSEAVQPS